MKHNNPGTMCSLAWLEHERRKAWQEGYAAGWKDQECDFPQYTSENPYKGDRRMKRNPFEIAFDNVLAGAAYTSQSSDSASVKEQHMDNVLSLIHI